MKKLIKGALFLALIGSVIVGCERDEYLESNQDLSTNQITKSKVNNYKIKWPRIKIKKGTYNNSGTCGLDLACGPCAGICIRFKATAPEVYGTDYALTPEEISDGISMADLTLIGNNKLIISLTDNSNAFENNELIFGSDENLGSNIASAFNVNEITIMQGIYAVDYTNNNIGDVTVDVIIN